MELEDFHVEVHTANDALNETHAGTEDAIQQCIDQYYPVYDKLVEHHSCYPLGRIKKVLRYDVEVSLRALIRERIGRDESTQSAINTLTVLPNARNKRIVNPDWPQLDLLDLVGLFRLGKGGLTRDFAAALDKGIKEAQSLGYNFEAFLSQLMDAARDRRQETEKNARKSRHGKRDAPPRFKPGDCERALDLLKVHLPSPPQSNIGLLDHADVSVEGHNRGDNREENEESRNEDHVGNREEAREERPITVRAEAKKKPTEMKPLLRQAESSKQTLHAAKDTDRIADSGATSANNAANSGDDAVQVPGNPDDSNYDGDSNDSTSISIEQGRHAVPEKRGLSDSGDDVAKFPGNADGSHSDSDDDDASPIEQARHTASGKRRSGDSPSSFRQRKRSRRSRNEDDVSSSRPRSSSGHSLIIVDDGFAASVEQFPPLSLSLPLKEDALPEARSSEFSEPSHPDGASEVVLNRATRTQDWIVQAKSTARENPTAPEKSTARENPTTREKSTAPEKSIIVPEKSIIVPGKSIIVPALPAFSLEDAKCAIANLLSNEEVKSSTVDLVLPLVVTLDWHVADAAASKTSRDRYKPLAHCTPETMPNILLPMCDNTHWVLVAISPAKETLLILDSFREVNFPTNKWQSRARRFCQSLHLDVESWVWTDQKCLQQHDFINCGVFTILNAAFIEDEPTDAPVDAAVVRYLLAAIVAVRYALPFEELPETCLAHLPEVQSVSETLDIPNIYRRIRQLRQQRDQRRIELGKHRQALNVQRTTLALFEGWLSRQRPPPGSGVETRHAVGTLANITTKHELDLVASTLGVDPKTLRDRMKDLGDRLEANNRRTQQKTEEYRKVLEMHTSMRLTVEQRREHAQFELDWEENEMDDDDES